MGDVQIADLNGDGVLDIAVGYRGLVGVKCVALDGKTLWSNRSLANVLGMAVGGPDATKQRKLFCTNDQSSLAVIDAAGKDAGRIALGDRLLYCDRRGRPRRRRPGGDVRPLGAQDRREPRPGTSNARGDLLWSYELPPGTPGQLVERVSAAKLLPDAPAQWLLAGTDGSIHVVSSDGKPIDRFNYGTLVGGLAATQSDGRRAADQHPAGRHRVRSPVEVGRVVHPQGANTSSPSAAGSRPGLLCPLDSGAFLSEND